MVTRRAAGILRPVDRLILAADRTVTPPDTSPVPSSVHIALVDPHWRRALEESAALLANHTWTWCRVHWAPTWSSASGSFATS
jgi:hypothetical protein